MNRLERVFKPGAPEYYDLDKPEERRAYWRARNRRAMEALCLAVAAIPTTWLCWAAVFSGEKQPLILLAAGVINFWGWRHFQKGPILPAGCAPREWRWAPMFLLAMLAGGISGICGFVARAAKTATEQL